MAAPVKKTTTSNTVPLTDILYRTLHYWPWVLLSLVICVGAGVLYLLRTPNIYTQSASILVKDDGKGKSASAGLDDFGDLGLITSNTNIQNEMTTLRSPDLMEEVVKRLHLDMNYYYPGRWHNTVAYGTTLPVQVEMPDYPDNGAASFKLSVTANGKVNISGLKFDGQEAPKEYSGKLNDTIRTAAGKILVKPSSSYNKEDIAEILIDKSPLTGTVSWYAGRLTVSMSNEKSTVIDLTFTDQNIQRADEVLNTVIGVYNENWIRDKNQIAVSTSNFINGRLNVIEAELGNVDSDISSYKSANLVPDVQAAATSYMAESQALGQELLGLNNQLQMTRYIRNYLSSEGNDDKALPTNTGVDNLELQSQIGEYNQKLLDRNALVAKSSEKNPLVQNMDKELNAMRSSIVGSVDNSIINLQTQMRGLQGARGAATSKLASNPSQAKYLLSVERQQKVKENLYLFLLQKREDNELNQAFTAYNTRVIKKPGGSTIPTSPNKKNILLACFLVGLAIPFGVVYVKETSNTKLRGRKDVKDLSLPMLGEIPEDINIKKLEKEGNKHQLVVEHGNRNVINEAFRVLRTNTEFTRINKDGCNVLAITSFNPGSGKSFITMNLATALAIRGKRVLVIDGDMRHGSTSQYVGKPKKGLAEYLNGEVNDIDSLLAKVPAVSGETPEHRVSAETRRDAASRVDGELSKRRDAAYHVDTTLSVLAVGTTPPNPTELLETPRFAQLIECMKRDYDYILIDCPPIEVVADAQIIDQYVDRTIFIIRAGLLERSMLPELDHLAEEKKYKHMAFILNGTRNDSGRYGYSHSYKYGYGYGYGYNYGEK